MSGRFDDDWDESLRRAREAIREVEERDRESRRDFFAEALDARIAALRGEGRSASQGEPG